MPSVEWNIETWNNVHPWTLNGGEWSAAWGSSEAQWHFSLLPRVRKFLPAQTILEIAPGFGRWTHFLMGHCERLIGVDLSWKCVDACRERFAAESNATFYLNDGYSLSMVKDSSVDFVFSFDSLVHAEWDVIAAYLSEISRVLTPDGRAFVHHSNAAALKVASNTSGRAESVSGDKVLAECERIGLSAISQERLDWNTDGLIDCLTVLTKAPSECVVVDNPNFMWEASHAAVTSRLYSYQADPFTT